MIYCQQTSRGYNQENSTGDGKNNCPGRVVSKKVDTGKKQQNRDPKCTQTEQPYKNTCHMGSKQTKEVVNMACGRGIVN